jgi:pimeloyl-ACP methyl ester carboxylesterase
VATFESTDGTRLAYHRAGDGPPLICLPGGPMFFSDYLGDLGGLSVRRGLVRLDLRGTGDSATPAETSSYRCDRQVDDVEALRAHLGLDRLDLVGHSAGATLALLYATRYPDRVDRLVLLNPSPRGIGLTVTDDDRRRVAELRRGEPWFDDAFAAAERIWSGRSTDADWDATAPFTYGRWDARTQSHYARLAGRRNRAAAIIYYETLDPLALRGAAADLAVPVLVVAGEYDPALPPANAAEYAGVFRRAELAVAAGAGHYPWLDDPDWFAATVA